MVKGFRYFAIYKVYQLSERSQKNESGTAIRLTNKVFKIEELFFLIRVFFSKKIFLKIE